MSIDLQVMDQTLDIQVFDYKGETKKFADLVESPSIVVVVFVRHFWCGSCQQYTAQLANTHKDNIIIIGCGEFNPIVDYADMTDFPKEKIFANPDRSLYHALGMTIETYAGTPSSQDRKSYLHKGLINNTLTSIMKGPLSHPSHIGKQGHFAQLGGELVFKDKKCIFAHRMQHTEDHTEIKDLLAF